MDTAGIIAHKALRMLFLPLQLYNWLTCPTSSPAVWPFAIKDLSYLFRDVPDERIAFARSLDIQQPVYPPPLVEPPPSGGGPGLDIGLSRLDDSGQLVVDRTRD